MAGVMFFPGDVGFLLCRGEVLPVEEVSCVVERSFRWLVYQRNGEEVLEASSGTVCWAASKSGVTTMRQRREGWRDTSGCRVQSEFIVPEPPYKSPMRGRLGPGEGRKTPDGYT